MSGEIREQPAALTEYARVPIAFEVRERLAIEAPDAGLGASDSSWSPRQVGSGHIGRITSRCRRTIPRRGPGAST
jgi:hypothetical protein